MPSIRNKFPFPVSIIKLRAGSTMDKWLQEITEEEIIAIQIIKKRIRKEFVLMKRYKE